MAPEDFDKDSIEKKAQELGNDAGDLTEDFADQAADHVDGMRGKAASSVSNTATQLREKAHSMGGPAEKAGDKVAGGMEHVSEYIQGHESKDMVRDAKRFANDHPMKTAVGAVILAFLLGKIMG